MQLTAPSQIAGDGTATLGYSLDDTSTQAATGVVTIQVTTTQGAVLSILLEVSVAPLTPVLAANPAYLDSGMVVGDQSLRFVHDHQQRRRAERRAHRLACRPRHT